MFVDAVARELIIAGLRPIGGAPVDEQHNGDRCATAHTIKKLPMRIIAELLRHFSPQMTNGSAYGLQLSEHVRVETRSARKANLLFPLCHIKQRLRHATPRAEEIDREDVHVLARTRSF